MNNQEAFTKSCEHLIKQGRRAISSTGLCMYRAPDGTMCAVGCLIPDDQYRDRLEGKGAAEVSIMVTELAGVSVKLLHGLQTIHDGCRVYDWRPALCELGERFGLRLPACLQEPAT